MVGVSWAADDTGLYIVHLTVLFDLCQNTESSLWRNQARYDFLCHILSRRPQKVFELDGTEFLYDGRLLVDGLVEALFEFIKFALLLIEVLDKSSPPLLHLVQSAFQSLQDTNHRSLNLSLILGVPDVVSNEFFD